MRDEVTELAVALGESQEAQIVAESRAVTFENQVNILTRTVEDQKLKIERLERDAEITNSLLEEKLKANNIPVDKG